MATRALVLIPLLKKYISKNAIVITDGWKSYSSLWKYFALHEVIIKATKVPYVTKQGKKTTKTILRFSRGKVYVNGVENVWRLVKRVYRNYISYSYKYTRRYLDEFAFLFNRKRKTSLERFLDLMDNALKTRITYKELIKDDWDDSDLAA